VKINLENKVAIITGASRGIGEAIARAYAASGAKVMLAARKAEGLRDVAESIGANAAWLPAHTGKTEDIKALFAETVAKFGRVDVLVNNAATNPYFGPMIGIDDAQWDKTFEVNIKGYFTAARLAAEHFGDRGGNIINVASVVALGGAPFQGVYAATKAAVVSMTQTLATELGPRNIRVNALAPGIIETRFAAALTTNEDIMGPILAKTPLGRAGKPEDVAGGALFLASDAAAFVTGHVLVIDGGLTARLL
jgi:NAD(P)-dependent dehydrogenase (short-subunit alcohol dehydrogenase family)